MNDGGPAFPQPYNSKAGMSLRDWFAGMALQALTKEGIISSSIVSFATATGRDKDWQRELIEATAAASYQVADAMLEARKK